MPKECATLSPVLVILCALLLWSGPLRATADSTGPEKHASRRDSYLGSWKLDRERSDAPDAMLDALEAPWWMRAVAGRARPRLVVSELGAGLQVITKNPIGSREQVLHCDDMLRNGEDRLGRSFRERSRWDADGALRVVRELELSNERRATIRVTWRRNDRFLVSATLIQVGDASPVRLKRVFVSDQELP